MDHHIRGQRGCDGGGDGGRLVHPPRHPLRIWRETHGVSQRQMAQRLLDRTARPLISRESISRIEQGLQAPSLELMAAVLEATAGAVTPNDFVAWAGRPGSTGEEPSCAST